MDGLRRLGYPLRLARLRLAHRLERVALVALGIAAGAAMLAATLGGSLLAQDRSLERATARIAPQDRAVRALWFGIPAQDAPRAQLDEWAIEALRPFGQPLRAMVYRETSVNGVLFDLAAVDRAQSFVHVTSGRLPRTCTPARCEVVQIGGSGPLPRGLNIVRVGKARLTSPLPFGNILTRETQSALIRQALAYHAPPVPPILLAEGAAETASLPALDFQYRSLAWIAPIYANRVHPWNAGSIGEDVERARGDLAAHSAQFDVAGPTGAIADARTQSRAAGKRLLLVGGEAAALLVAFTLLAATRLRRDTDAAWRRLTWFGARRWQLVALTAAEAAVIATVGVVVGWAVGCVATAYAAHRAGGGGELVTRGPLAGTGISAAVVALLVATLVLVLALRTRGVRVGGVSLSIVDALALGALAAIAIGLARGSADAASLVRGGGTGTFLLLVPGLIAFVGAVAAARLLAPALRVVERRLRGAPVASRLAALSLARNSGHAAVAVAFVVVSIGFALFAGAYRATLQTGQRERASFVAPEDAVVREDLTKLVPVFDAAPLAAYQRLGHASPVVRLSGGIPGAQQPFTVLGLPPDELPRLRSRPPDAEALAAELRMPARTSGVPVAHTLEVRARVDGDPLKLAVDVASPRGFAHVPLGTLRRGTTVVRRAVPAGRLVGFTFGVADSGLHSAANGGTGAQTIATGTLHVLSPKVDWRGVNGITPVRAGVVRYVVAPDTVARLRAPQSTDDKPLPVLATPAVAARAGQGGRLAITVEGRPLVVRVVATIPRFATARGDAIVADVAGVVTALNADAPGSAAVNEVWLRDADVRALARPPFDTLAVTTHAAVAHSLDTDPLARGVLLILAAAALVALALALVGLALGVVADVRDEQGDLFDLESQGASPGTMLAQLRLRAAAVGIAGAVGGIVLGLVLASLVVDVVALAAGAARPQPPLHLVLGWPLVLGALVALVAAAAVVTVVLTRRAFAGRSPARWTEVGA